jgi:ABC-2 type transport system ATP-binding protein
MQIKRGELFGLLGPNGAGKTTLIKILCTLVLPNSGKAFVSGLEVTEDGKKIRRTIGYVVSDERSFYWRLTGRQNLKFYAKLNNIPNREADLRIERLLEFMELRGDADRMFKDYSTGMRQKLAIARGLLTDPQIIFMDEPTRSLDPPTAQNLRRLIKEEIVGEEKKTVVFATHNLMEAEGLCDRIAIIHKGEVKVTGTMEEIKREMSSNKKYLIRLKTPENGLLEKISNMKSIKEIIPISNSSLPGRIQIEVETIDVDGNISQLVKEIIDIGGKIYSFNERETSLGDLFLKFVDTEDKRTGR